MTATVESSRWLREWAPSGDAEHLAVCLHEAGAGAAQFRQLQVALGEGFQVVAVQMPGRQERWREPLVRRMDDVLAELIPVLLKRLDRPYVVLGQSMGALLGYELIRVLGHHHQRWPLAFFPCACPPPQLITTEFTRQATDQSEIRNALLAAADGAEVDDTAAELLLKPLRADAELVRQYRHVPGPPLTCSVYPWCGTQDPQVALQQLAGWRDHTSGDFCAEEFPGGHIFLPQCLDLVAQGIRRAVGSRGGDGSNG
ncbi:thioesterase II family protein [Streptomyces sp. NPDC019531]|uniref:thioesterase II family protein n=1 Tax=Streptomyces sp. NPDC019531 TaxID=3365062 RepID=UPI00384A6864